MTTTVNIRVATSHQGKAVRLRIVSPASKDPAVPLTEGHVWRDQVLVAEQNYTEHVHDGARIILDEVDEAKADVQQEGVSESELVKDASK